jgi:hypothetical protein
MVFTYLKGLIVIKEIFHIVLVYLLWCFCIQYLVLNTPYQIDLSTTSKDIWIHN